MKKNINIIFALLLFKIATINGQVKNHTNDTQKKLDKISQQYFIENKGQWPLEVLYLTQMKGLNTWITTRGVQLELYKIEKNEENTSSISNYCQIENIEYKCFGQRINYDFVNCNSKVVANGKIKQKAYKNFFVGKDQNKYATNVALYGQVIVNDIYEGIDIRYYFEDNFLKYDFIVHPWANANQIEINIIGSDKTYLNTKGELVLTTLFGEIQNANLYCYQQENKKKVEGKFTNNRGNWSLDLETYDKSQTLIIDPLIYATYIGGSFYDDANSIVVDSSNNVYVCGYTNSINYDITPGAFQISYAGSWDVFVSKLNSDGTNLIYSTYIGGNGSDYATSNAVDANNNLYITGYTTSTDFITTTGAYQTINNGGVDGFITKLNTSGTALIYSTYIGGNNGDYSRAIAIDTSNNAYITGNTNSNNFVTSNEAFQNVYNGLEDIFVCKLNESGNALIYSTYIGSFNNEFGQSIALDNSGNAYITGWAHFGFPTTPGAFQTINGGGSDAIVVKLNSLGTSLTYSTFIGGNGPDSSYDIAIDSSNNVYITGDTESSNFYVSPNALQTTREGGWTDAFITKINASGTAIIYSTYLGGNGDDTAHSIALDTDDNAHITGRTESTNFDITSGAFQTTKAAGRDVFASKLNSTGSGLLYSTYIGGNNNEVGLSIAIDSFENAYLTGLTWSTNFYTTNGAFQTANSGTRDLFVVKLDMLHELSINENVKNNLFSVYPNPSQGVYQIVFNNITMSDLDIKVYDLTGRLVFNQKVNYKNNLYIDLSKEASGVYLIKINTSHVEQINRLIKL
ncbi:MAG: T9SS type A sorting domain-containing protein [Flavobacteriaceae bacterium]|nr:MAG: T9SS type A sorting domain-containing protein [Flavobacteriaceae bacterium]